MLHTEVVDYMENIFLLIINEKLYQAGEIDQTTKEKIEMEIKGNINCGKNLQ